MIEQEGRTCNRDYPMKVSMLWREFTRGDLLLTVEAADHQNGSISCWDQINHRHDYTDYMKRYGFEWRQSETEFAVHLQISFRRVLMDGWAETESSLSRRIFRQTDGNSNKFWIICLHGNEYEVHYGRIPKYSGQWHGNVGVKITKNFLTRKLAISAYDRIIRQKLSHGYVEVQSRFPLDAKLRSRDVLALAQAAYEERIMPSGELDPARLAVLSDALEEAGCDNPDILAHLRSLGPHVRGCWVVDLLLGKE
jgi:predicted DNA-binding WGR domain protein